MPNEWAAFFDQREYEQFLAAVESHLQRLGWTYEIRQDHIFVPDSESLYGLINLAQWCAQHDADQWAQLVQDHFSRLIATREAQQKLDRRLQDFEVARPMLAVRLWHPDSLPPETLSNVVHRVDVEGTISVLVVDLPESVMSVSRDMALQWNHDDSSLFNRGLENVMRKSAADAEWIELEDDLKVLLVFDDSFLVSGHALCLSQHPDWIGQFGSLVGIPARDSLLIYPIRDAKCVRAVAPMIALIAQVFDEGPSSISSSLYWFRDGHFMLLPHTVTNDRIQFAPPQDFNDMLDD
jgi:hypothetical protein